MDRVGFAVIFCTVAVLVIAAVPNLFEFLGTPAPDSIQVFLFGMLVGGSMVYVADP